MRFARGGPAAARRRLAVVDGAAGPVGPPGPASGPRRSRTRASGLSGASVAQCGRSPASGGSCCITWSLGASGLPYSYGQRWTSGIAPGQLPCGRRGGGRPLQAVGVPGILAGLLALERAPEEVHEEEDLGGAEDDRAHGDELVEALQRLQEVVLVGVVDAPHVAGDADVVHGEERPVVGDEGEPEVPLAQRLVHHAAEHLREPEGGGAEDAEQGRPGHDQVEVGDHEEGVVEVDVGRALAQPDAGEPAADEEGDDAHRPQHRRRVLDARAARGWPAS